MVHVNENRGHIEWKLKQDGEFTVEFYYKYLVGREHDGIPNFLAHQSSKLKAPPMVAFFTWEASHECMLTIDKIMKRGKIMVNGCYMCEQVAESYSHIFLWCPMMYELNC